MTVKNSECHATHTRVASKRNCPRKHNKRNTTKHCTQGDNSNKTYLMITAIIFRVTQANIKRNQQHNKCFDFDPNSLLSGSKDCVGLRLHLFFIWLNMSQMKRIWYLYQIGESELIRLTLNRPDSLHKTNNGSAYKSVCLLLNCPRITRMSYKIQDKASAMKQWATHLLRFLIIQPEN